MLLPSGGARAGGVGMFAGVQNIVAVCWCAARGRAGVRKFPRSHGRTDTRTLHTDIDLTEERKLAASLRVPR